MSTTHPQRQKVCEFEDCENEGEEWEFTDGRFCSTECRNRSQAASILNLLKFDHRYCASCWTRLKTISRPTDEQLRHIEGKYSADAVVGFQYPEPDSEIGEITTRADTYDTVVTGLVCGNCGTTDHTDDYFRDFEPREAAKRLRKRIFELKEEGQHSYDFSTQAFVEAWNESADWELSLGRALE